MRLHLQLYILIMEEPVFSFSRHKSIVLQRPYLEGVACMKNSSTQINNKRVYNLPSPGSH